MSVTIYHLNFATGEMIIEHDGRYISLEEDEIRHEQRVSEVEKNEKERTKETKINNKR